jgi:hypothetical protein
VNCRLEEKAAGDLRVARPFGIEQLATVHLHVGGMRLVSLGEHLFQLGIDGSEAAIVSNLKNPAALLSDFHDSLRIGDVGGHRFLTKDVLAIFDREDRQLSVFGVGCGDVDGVTHGENFRDAVSDIGVNRTRQNFRACLYYIVNRRHLDAIVARQD